MELYNLEKDIIIFCMDVPTFPNGIPETFERLAKLLPSINDRVFYGISYMNEPGKMVYKTAVSAKTNDEAEQYNCELFTITKGEYLTETIMDWRNNIIEIGKTFQAIFRDERIDKTSVCIEWYKTNIELTCMVKTK